MTTLAVTMKGQITLKRDLLQHLGVKLGEKVELDMLPNGELRIKAAQASGTIDDFIGCLAGKTKKVATIEEMNEVIAAGWAGEQ